MSDFPPRPSDIPENIYDMSRLQQSVQDSNYSYSKEWFRNDGRAGNGYGYAHPPRAARDVRENGIPLKTLNVVSRKTGRVIGAYSFDTDKPIAGRIGGRKAFPLN